jgi:hypothetical protein
LGANGSHIQKFTDFPLWCFYQIVCWLPRNTLKSMSFDNPIPA